MSLHVWADNPGALRLYHDAGFRSVRTIAIEPGGQLDHSGGMLLLVADLPLTMADAA
jgi:ribosomal protein S18 acetylase RimI-like enzyme